MTQLVALPVVVPFLAASVLVAAGSFSPRWFNDGVGGGTAVAATTLCALLAVHSAGRPFAYWLGGWRPEPGSRSASRCRSIRWAPGWRRSRHCS